MISVLIFGTLGMLLLAGGIILFVIMYQKRVIAQKAELQEKELSYQQSLLKATVQAQELASERIARDLHDQVGGMLSAVRLQLALMNGQGDSPVGQLKSQIDDTLNQVRSISHELIPPTLKKFGLADALQKLVKKHQSSQPEISLQVNNYESRVPLESEVHLYRIAQEALTNALKHAEAREIHLRLQGFKPPHPFRLLMVISDDGKGFDPEASSTDGESHLGLLNLASRAKLLYGQLAIQSEKGMGSQITISIPHLTPQKNEDPSLGN